MATAITMIVSVSMLFWDRKVEEKLKALLIPDHCCTNMSPTEMESGSRSAGSRSMEPSVRDRPPDGASASLVSSLGVPLAPWATAPQASTMQKSSSWSCGSSMGVSRSCMSTSSAGTSMPAITYQRGLSSSQDWSMSCMAAGTQITARRKGQRSTVPRKAGRPSTWATSMATTMVSWKAVPRVPRSWGGEISPRYMGTTTVAPPHETPDTARPTIRVSTRRVHTQVGSATEPGAQGLVPSRGQMDEKVPPESGQVHAGRKERPSRRPPTMKSRLFTRRKCLRPQRSASWPDMLQPSSAPRQKTETQKPQMASLVGKGEPSAATEGME
mmetsp:Transcript_27087/g.90650  ORF Transcript_27087/g.90650 Transcript_27087/m.90650 type:complete len:327 (+) Transcript_27087:851-1831(+)